MANDIFPNSKITNLSNLAENNEVVATKPMQVDAAKANIEKTQEVIAGDKAIRKNAGRGILTAMSPLKEKLPLPAELRAEVYSHLDVKSLVKLRGVNQTTYYDIGSLPNELKRIEEAKDEHFEPIRKKIDIALGVLRLSHPSVSFNASTGLLEGYQIEKRNSLAYLPDFLSRNVAPYLAMAPLVSPLLGPYSFLGPVAMIALKAGAAAYPPPAADYSELQINYTERLINHLKEKLAERMPTHQVFQPEEELSSLSNSNARNKISDLDAEAFHSTNMKILDIERRGNLA
jgi:hypothetical protein